MASDAEAMEVDSLKRSDNPNNMTSDVEAMEFDSKHVQAVWHGGVRKTKTGRRAKRPFFVLRIFGMAGKRKTKPGGVNCTNKSKSSNNDEKIQKCVVRI